MNKDELVAFETEIKDIFLDGQIRAPVHLCGGNEDALIKIFKDVKPDDWVFSTHRSHYHALLKGIPKEWLKAEIIKGNSIHLMNKEHKFFTSAIVGGICPIAVGVAMAIKRKGGRNKVWVFIGDMAAEMGVTSECVKYARNFKLPIRFVVEDNGLSTNTPTKETWGGESFFGMRYKYERVYPHINAGKWVVFR